MQARLRLPTPSCRPSRSRPCGASRQKSRWSLRRMPAIAPPSCHTLLPGRSARRHQGVHPEAHRFHHQCRLIEDGAPGLRPRLCAGAIAAGADARRWQRSRPSLRQTSAAPISTGSGCDQIEVRAPAPDGLVAVVSLSHLDAETEAFLGPQDRRQSSAGSSLKFLKSPAAMPMSILASAPPWNGTPPPAMPCCCSRRHCDRRRGGQLRYGKSESGLRNAEFHRLGLGAPRVNAPAASRLA